MRAIQRAGLCLAVIPAIAIPAAILFAQAAPPAPAVKAQTRAEAETRAMAMFDRLDGDHDGYVTRAEADAAGARMHARMAERMKRWHDAGFARMDANKDGSISRAEYDAATASRPRFAGRDGPPPAPPVPPMPPRQGVAPPAPPPVPPVPQMMGHHSGHRGMGHHLMGGRMMAGALFDRIDADHDGRVSRAEAKAAADQHFAMRDQNRDGRIGPDEMRGRRGHRWLDGKPS